MAEPTDQGNGNTEPLPRVLAAGCKGAILTVVFSFPWAALIALAYGFPIPFAGKMSGPAAILPSQLAVLMYGLLGGFVILAVLGAAAGLLALWASETKRSRFNTLCLVLSSIVSGACVLFLTILDLLIGRW